MPNKGLISSILEELLWLNNNKAKSNGQRAKQTPHQRTYIYEWQIRTWKDMCSKTLLIRKVQTKNHI